MTVLPETAWRRDQKEPEIRQEMARRAIEAAFRDLPCGDLDPPGGIREFSRWSGQSEAALLESLSHEGVDTAVLLRIEELTPRLYVSLSLPFLWSGCTEADLRLRVLSVGTGSVQADLRIRRTTGGPFQLRPARWAEQELEAALLGAIGGGAAE